MPRLTVFMTHSPSALANYYGPRALGALQAVAAVQRGAAESDWTAQTLAAAARDCDIIVSDRRAACSAELLARLPRLLAVCRCAVDIRNIDVAAASAQGILVTQASAGFVNSVTEWIVGAMLELSRGIGAAAATYHAGAVPVARMGRELRGATLGIVGYGRIGRRLADAALALGMRVIVADPATEVTNPGLRKLPLAELLPQADYTVCLATATPQTENLIDAAAFAAMRASAFFINASRGNLVDEEALLQALNTGRIAGCALDVGRAPDQMPSLQLARHPRVIATPHSGGLTLPAIEHQSMETVQQVTDIVHRRMPQGGVNAVHATRLRTFIDAG